MGESSVNREIRSAIPLSSPRTWSVWSPSGECMRWAAKRRAIDLALCDVELAALWHQLIADVLSDSSKIVG